MALLVLTGPMAGERIEAVRDLVFGREDADVTIDDPEMSRKHARLRVTGNGLEIEDLGSLNGTLVNDVTISTSTVLQPGDVIELGQTRIEVQRDRAAATVVRQVQAVEPEHPVPAATEDAPAAVPATDRGSPGGPSLPAPPPVQATPVEPPPTPVEAPAAPVEPPVAPVEPPVAPVEPPVAQMEPPVAPLEPLVAPAEPPAAPEAGPPRPPGWVSTAADQLGAAAVPVAPVGITYTHAGYRFLLGYGSELCGIWDRSAGQQPVMTFPRTDQGWQEAWQVFTSWEPESRAVEASAPGTPAASVPASPRAADPHAGIPVPSAANVVYAGFWRRFAAIFIDGLLLSAVFSPFSRSAMSANAAPGRVLALSIVELVVGWLYSALQESSRFQATLGKRALKIVVTDLQGRRIGFPRASGRYFAKLLSTLTLGVGYLMAAFTPRKQALHDLIADTLVVRSP